MDRRVMKLDRCVDGCLTAIQVEQLVANDFDTPRKIRAASDAELKAIRGIGDAAVTSLRECFPQQ